MPIKLDVQKQTVPAIVDLYILDLNPIGIGEVYYFYPMLSIDGGDIVYQGNTYVPWPIEMIGFEKRGTGSEPRPKASISNIGGSISQLVKSYDDLIGATLTRRRTLATYISNDLADYYDEIYFIEQKTLENSTIIEFEMVTAMDFVDKQLPGRVAVANACPWLYGPLAVALGKQSQGCSWPGTNPAKWFDSLGNAVGTQGQDVCGKKLSDCKLRFGATAELDYGGFPSLGRNG